VAGSAVDDDENIGDLLTLCLSEQIQSDINPVSSVMANEFLTPVRIDAITQMEKRITERISE
jgi:hypothetical protein